MAHQLKQGANLLLSMIHAASVAKKVTTTTTTTTTTTANEIHIHIQILYQQLQKQLTKTNTNTKTNKNKYKYKNIQKQIHKQIRKLKQMQKQKRNYGQATTVLCPGASLGLRSQEKSLRGFMVAEAASKFHFNSSQFSFSKTGTYDALLYLQQLPHPSHVIHQS